MGTARMDGKTDCGRHRGKIPKRILHMFENEVVTEAEYPFSITYHYKLSVISTVVDQIYGESAEV